MPTGARADAACRALESKLLARGFTPKKRLTELWVCEMLGFGWTACTLLLPGSRSAWPYRVGQPDLDLLDRDYRPELARGGAQIRLIDPGGGDRRLLTRGFNGPGADHFRWVRLATSVT